MCRSCRENVTKSSIVSGLRSAVANEEGREKNSSSPIVRSEWVYRETRKSNGGHEDVQPGSALITSVNNWPMQKKDSLYP